MNQALWKGQWVPVAELEGRLSNLGADLAASRDSLDTEAVLASAEKLSARLQVPGALRDNLLLKLEATGEHSPQQAAETISELAEFLRRENLEEKLVRELCLGDARLHPFQLERIDYRREIFEAWAPVGFLVHIAPTNSANVPFLSVIEGLLAGNVNFLKTGGEDTGYALECLKALIDADSSHALGTFVYAAHISSSKTDLLRQLLSEADAIAVWGAEEAISGIRELAPAQARIVDWGPKISLAYIEQSQIENPLILEPLAKDCCLLEQQACSSPQVIYLDTSDRAVLLDFGNRFGAAMEKVSARTPVTKVPSLQEQAELTKVRAIAELETCIEGNHTRAVISGDRWCLFLDANPGLKASPLYRTVWIKPLPKARIAEVLRPLRHYLQTVGLAADSQRLPEITAALFRSGVLRVTSLGEMLGGYMGEPHDGVYALQRYARRISIRLDGSALKAISSLDELKQAHDFQIPLVPVMTKEDFVRQSPADKHAEVYFKSGGSSGEPKLSIFTYDDYGRQMKAAAQGIFAAGLEPGRDRCMNLFFGGGLYGGFLSFFTILEELKAVQFPMGAHADLEVVAKTIRDKNVNVLLGMPSYLLRLFEEQREVLKGYRGVGKIFYGGEHFNDAQRERLQGDFGVKLIRSAAYGGNDTGPMGYQCSHCSGTQHHLQDGLHTLEILEVGQDSPVENGEMGRLVLTSRARQGQLLNRYDVGDLGRWSPDSGHCACGRKSPKFELLGRHGDIFKAGGMFLNYRKLASILSQGNSFSGEFQIILENGMPENMTLRYSSGEGWDPDKIRRVCVDGYKDLRESIVEDKAITFRCESVPANLLERAAGSGKLKVIVDRRTSERE